MHRLARHVVTMLAVLSLLLCAMLCALSAEVHHPIHVGCLLLLPIAWPAAWGWQSYRQRRLLRQRIAAGLCVVCGFDLRATPCRCPECGTVISASEIPDLP